MVLCEITQFRRNKCAGEAFRKVFVRLPGGQQRKVPVEKHESRAMLMLPVAFYRFYYLFLFIPRLLLFGTAVTSFFIVI